MIRGEAICVVRGGRTLLDGVDCAVEPGRMMVVIGPNGAGKSTLLKVLAGEIAPSSGTVSVDGRALESYSARELAQRRAVMWQTAEAAPGLSLLELVTLGRTPFGDGAARTGEEAVLRAIHKAGLQGMELRRADTLSGGERQRADFARTLCQIEGMERPTVLLDEPTASLDLKHQYHLLRTAHGLAQGGAAVLCVLHDLSLVRRFADQVVALKEGRVFAQGPADTIVTDDAIADLYDLPHDLRLAV